MPVPVFSRRVAVRVEDVGKDGRIDANALADADQQASGDDEGEAAVEESRAAVEMPRSDSPAVETNGVSPLRKKLEEAWAESER